MQIYKELLKDYLVSTVELVDDGVIGIPVSLAVYTVTDASVISPVVHYVIGTNTEHIGTESDESILSDLVKEYITVVIDYHGHEKATGLALDYSLHHLRRLIIDENFVIGERKFYRDADNWILPAGCRLWRRIPYYNFRDHAPDGILDYIVKIWNEDFTETRGNRKITKADGTEILVRDVHPTSVEECLRPDGRPVDLNLYFDIIYPSNPAIRKRCPVAAHAASRQSTTGNWVMAHFPGYVTSQLFSGYGVLLYEFPYVPMARTDHYGYFPDGPTYKLEHCDRHHGMGFYTGVHSSTAAIRTFRYLCATHPELSALDPERIGVHCISKTGYNYALAVPHPEDLPEKRYLEGHHGECAEGVVQPCLSYPDGSPISSQVQAMYSVAGTGEYFVRDGMSPVMTTVGEYDSHHFYREVTENARERDDECLFYTVPDLGHAMAYGYDPRFHLDMYCTVLDFMDHHLAKTHGECAYITPSDASVLSADAVITLHFTGAVSREELSKYDLLTDRFGRCIPYHLTPSYGNCVWTLATTLPDDARPVTVTVPKGLTFQNGVQTTRTLTHTYRTSVEHTVAYLRADGTLLDHGHTVTFAPVSIGRQGGERTYLRFSTVGTSAQTVGVYLDGERIAEVGVGAEGVYSVDITDAVPLWKPVTLSLRAEREIGERPYRAIDPSSETGYELTLGEYADAYHATAPDGTPVLALSLDEYHYTTARGYRLRLPLKDTPWDKSDLGRLFRIRARLLSPSSRHPRGTYVRVPYNAVPDDPYVDTTTTARRLLHPEHTPNEWVDTEFFFSLDRPALLTPERDARFVEITHDAGEIYLGALSVTEITTPVTLGLGASVRIVNSGLSHG